MSFPSVTAVIPAHQRQRELRAAIEAVLAQDYEGAIDVLVVFDRAEPDLTLNRSGPRSVQVLRNSRTPGLAGTRNTGILASTGEFIAFCDDDDIWLPNKLSKQISEFSAFPDAPLVTTSITVEYQGRSTPRYAGTTSVTHSMLVKSRMSMLHSSTLLFRRQALLEEVGLISEDIPGSQNEDWDILLRTSAVHPIVHIDKPLVRVVWGKASHFSRRWDTKIDSSIWMLEKHPAVANHPAGAARLMGQIAFAHACSGQRRQAWKWSAQALKRNPLEWRGALSSAVALAPRSGELVLATLHRFGRGV